MVKNDGGVAFPVAGQIGPEQYGFEPGMTLRDWFAGQALAMSAPKYMNLSDSAALLAKRCYAVADAMLAEREK